MFVILKKQNGINTKLQKEHFQCSMLLIFIPTFPEALCVFKSFYLYMMFLQFIWTVKTLQFMKEKIYIYERLHM